MLHESCMNTAIYMARRTVLAMAIVAMADQTNMHGARRHHHRAMPPTVSNVTCSHSAAAKECANLCWTQQLSDMLRQAVRYLAAQASSGASPDSGALIA